MEKQILPRDQHGPGAVSSTKMVLCGAPLARRANLVQTRAQRSAPRTRFYQIEPAASLANRPAALRAAGIGRSAGCRPLLCHRRLYENQRRSLAPTRARLSKFRICSSLLSHPHGMHILRHV